MCACACICVHLCACSCTGRCVCVHMYAFTCGEQRAASSFIPRNIMHLLWNMVSHCLGTQQVFLTFWSVCHRISFLSLPSIRITSVHHCDLLHTFKRVLVIKLSLPCLCGKHLWAETSSSSLKNNFNKVCENASDTIWHNAIYVCLQ